MGQAFAEFQSHDLKILDHGCKSWINNDVVLLHRTLRLRHIDPRYASGNIGLAETWKEMNLQPDLHSPHSKHAHTHTHIHTHTHKKWHNKTTACVYLLFDILLFICCLLVFLLQHLSTRVTLMEVTHVNGKQQKHTAVWVLSGCISNIQSKHIIKSQTTSYSYQLELNHFGFTRRQIIVLLVCLADRFLSLVVAGGVALQQ